MSDLKLLKNLNLLYAEDDEIIQEQYSEIFKSFFKNVYIANNGIKALEIFQKKSIHIIVTDVKMPLMDGLELIDEIRKTNDKVPIFVTSSYSDKEYLLKAVRQRLIEYIVKPATYKIIKETLLRSIDELEKNNTFEVVLNETCTYSPLTKILKNGENTIVLQHKEEMLLELFIKYRQQLVSRELIELNIYFDEPMTEGALKNLIYKLRKKIGDNVILTIKNAGYILK